MKTDRGCCVGRDRRYLVGTPIDRAMSIVSDIIAYEEGDLSDRATVELFARLVKTGMAWTLQGHYGRTATALIENGYIDRQGLVQIDLDDLDND